MWKRFEDYATAVESRQLGLPWTKVAITAGLERVLQAKSFTKLTGELKGLKCSLSLADMDECERPIASRVLFLYGEGYTYLLIKTDILTTIKENPDFFEVDCMRATNIMAKWWIKHVPWVLSRAEHLYSLKRRASALAEWNVPYAAAVIAEQVAKEVADEEEAESGTRPSVSDETLRTYTAAIRRHLRFRLKRNVV